MPRIEARPRKSVIAFFIVAYARETRETRDGAWRLNFVSFFFRLFSKTVFVERRREVRHDELRGNRAKWNETERNGGLRELRNANVRHLLVKNISLYQIFFLRWITNTMIYRFIYTFRVTAGCWLVGLIERHVCLRTMDSFVFDSLRIGKWDRGRRKRKRGRTEGNRRSARCLFVDFHIKILTRENFISIENGEHASSQKRRARSIKRRGIIEGWLVAFTVIPGEALIVPVDKIPRGLFETSLSLKIVDRARNSNFGESRKTRRRKKLLIDIVHKLLSRK